MEENKAYERQRVQEGRRGGGEEEGWKGRYGMSPDTPVHGILNSVYR